MGGRGNGYLKDGFMSVNARDAYERKEMPLHKWTKDAIISEINELKPELVPYFKKWKTEDLRKYFLRNAGWHHTGKNYKRTYFYDINEDTIEYFSVERLENWNNREAFLEEAKVLGEEYRKISTEIKEQSSNAFREISNRGEQRLREQYSEAWEQYKQIRARTHARASGLKEAIPINELNNDGTDSKKTDLHNIVMISASLYDKKIVPILIIVRNTINTNSGNLLKLFPLKSLNAKIAHQEHNKVDSQVSSSNGQLL